MKRFLLALLLLPSLALGQTYFPTAEETDVVGVYRPALGSIELRESHGRYTWDKLNTLFAEIAHLHTGVYDPAGTTSTHNSTTASIHGITDTATLELTTRKDANSGYVGRTAGGNASIPGTFTAGGFSAGEDDTH